MSYNNSYWSEILFEKRKGQKAKNRKGKWPKYQKQAKAKRPNEAWQALDVLYNLHWNKTLIERAEFCLFV